MHLHELVLISGILGTFHTQFVNSAVLSQKPQNRIYDINNHNNNEEDEKNLNYFVKRGYKDNDNAYIRFGKRSDEQTEVEGDLQHIMPLPAQRSESAYIRFGKRSSLSTSSPCTIHYLRSLPTQEMRVKHLRSCTMSRATRGHDDGYIRFGKRGGGRQVEDFGVSEEDEPELTDDDEVIQQQLQARRCFFLVPQLNNLAEVRHCKELARAARGDEI